MALKNNADAALLYVNISAADHAEIKELAKRTRRPLGTLMGDLVRWRLRQERRQEGGRGQSTEAAQ